ncbi:MAG: hypothetical protein JWO47_884 [Candidatus Saccharibacteria bacterium]|nr:hypothetical protein [Candidatus Saccharibacteria bacterium]
MATPDQAPLDLVAEYCAFVDEMSGGKPALGAKESWKTYKIVGGTVSGLVLVNEVDFFTTWDEAASERLGETQYIRTIESSYEGFKRAEDLHRVEGFSVWLPGFEGNNFVEEGEDESKTDFVCAVARHSLAQARLLRDAGRLQVTDQAD